MNLPPFLKSRKFWALIVGACVIVIRAYVPTLPIDDAKLTELGLLFIAYILGVGLEDFGKARWKLERQALPLNAKGPQPK